MRIEAVDGKVVATGYGTAGICQPGTQQVGTGAMGDAVQFLGMTLDSRGLNSWFGAVFVMLTGFGLFELTRRQFSLEWGEIQTEIEKEIKRRETL